MRSLAANNCDRALLCPPPLAVSELSRPEISPLMGLGESEAPCSCLSMVDAASSMCEPPSTRALTLVTVSFAAGCTGLSHASPQR